MCGWLCARVPGVFLLMCFPFPSPFSVLCTADSFTLSSAKVTKICLVGNCTFVFHSSNLPYPPSPWQFCPRRFHDCATSPTYASNLVWLHGSSSTILACVDCHHLVLLHLSTLLRVITALGFFVTDPSHGSHAVGNHAFQKRDNPICIHVFLAVLQVLA